MNPYELCPILETERFTLRLVAEEDAESLLKCYSDTKAQKLFNADRCSGDFCMDKLDDVKACIHAWLYAYSQQDFVRFSIIDRADSKAVGTAEMFGYVGKYKFKTGILRVDICSEYENADYLSEILKVCHGTFFDLFEVETIAIKAIPLAVERRSALSTLGFEEGIVYEGEHYFLSSK